MRTFYFAVVISIFMLSLPILGSRT